MSKLAVAPSKKKTKAKHPMGKLVSTKVHPQHLHSLIKKFQATHRTWAKSNWFAVDKKTGDAKNVVPDEISAMRGVIRVALGQRPIPIRMAALFGLVSTVTSGVITTVSIAASSNGRLNVADFSEFSSLLALFDEVKAESGHVEFVLYCQQVAATAATTIPSYAAHRIAFDTTDGAAATSTTSLAELANNRMIAPPAVAAATLGGAFQPPPHRFAFKIPKGDVVGSNSTVGDAWQDASITVPVGYLRYYGVSANVTATNVADGIVFLDTLWRCRE